MNSEVPQMKYYPIVKQWSKIKTHLNDKELNNFLVSDFNQFTLGNYGRPFTHGMYPRDFEGCDWDWRIRGRRPQYWKFVKHGACHWLVNFNLKLAMLVEPSKGWRILTSQHHSTVWDGEDTLFDLNFLALGVSPDECWSLANDEQLRIGEYMKVNYPISKKIDAEMVKKILDHFHEEYKL